MTCVLVLSKLNSMSLPKPFPHIYRNVYEEVYPAFADMVHSPEGRSSVEALKLLQKDLRHLFQYIEPATANLQAYSHRSYELLLRACTEIESNAKIIFDKNHATPSEPNIKGYSDLEGPMKLSQYELHCYTLNIANFRPFEAFADPVRDQRSPAWYRAYNLVKHNRASNFASASLSNVISAVGAVYALLDAQFGYGFQLEMNDRQWSTNDDQIFSLKTVPTWTAAEEYSFKDWPALKASGNPYNHCPIPRRP